jgi:EpsI family protein
MRTPLKVAALAALLTAAALVVWLNPPERLTLGADSLAAFPAAIGEWRSEDLEFEDVVYQELEADATLVRRYSRDDGATVWFVVIFHQNDRYGAHDPVVCYTAHGWKVVDRGTLRLARAAGDIDAQWIRLMAGDAERLALYWWYTAGDLATGDRDEFMARMASSGIVSNTTFGAFMRVSAVVEDGDLDAAQALAREFAEAALPHLSEVFTVDGNGGADEVH